ncbi:lysophospholipid acyltransferase family protein [Candidatus Poribacteria bacterium]|nr:lysophospholipid acyltransferase family protein [Candidatus Poribacteria bacterium]
MKQERRNPTALAVGGVKDWCYAFAVKSIGFCVSRLPRSVTLAIGGWLGVLVFWLAPQQRELACDHLRGSLTLSDERQVKVVAKQCFENLGKTVVEFMQFPRLNRKQIQRHVTFAGTEHVQQALALGKGAIILTGHFGNWELLAASISATIAPLTPIVRELRSPRLNTLVSSYREKAGYRTIDRDTGVRHALRCLKRNELLGIVADVDTAVSGVFVDFFGRHAYTPYSPVAIALKTGAAILPTFIVRQPDDSHHAIIEPPLVLKRTAMREKDLVVNTQKFTKIIESYIRRYPAQWIWMHRRWKTQP